MKRSEALKKYKVNILEGMAEAYADLLKVKGHMFIYVLEDGTVEYSNTEMDEDENRFFVTVINYDLHEYDASVEDPVEWFADIESYYIYMDAVRNAEWNEWMDEGSAFVQILDKDGKVMEADGKKLEWFDETGTEWHEDTREGNR